MQGTVKAIENKHIKKPQTKANLVFFLVLHSIS